MSDAPTLQERYSRAINSSHLEARHSDLGGNCDADVLGAAAFAAQQDRDDHRRQQRLGIALLALQIEYDQVRGDKGVALRNVGEFMEIAHSAATGLRDELALQSPNPERVQKLTARAAEYRQKATHEAAQAQAFILLKLTRLSSARCALGEWAVIQATKQRFMEPDDKVGPVAGMALRAFLEPKCITCTGRGFLGGYSAPQIKCRTCKGSGSSREEIGKTPEQVRFGQFLLAEMERFTSQAEIEMRRCLGRDAKAT